MHVGDFEVSYATSGGPDTDLALLRLGLESKEQGVMLPIRPYKEGVSQALLNQPGIDHLVARIDIGQDAAVTVSSLLIELQSDFPPHDERFVGPFGFQIEWLLKFGRVDAQIPNFPAIFEKNGIPIVDPLDSDEFLGG
jgi:hypothetical protein